MKNDGPPLPPPSKEGDSKKDIKRKSAVRRYFFHLTGWDSKKGIGKIIGSGR